MKVQVLKIVLKFSIRSFTILHKNILIIFSLFIFSQNISAQWSSVTNGSSGDIWDIAFKNESTGWYRDGGMFKTTNGGQTWDYVQSYFYDSSSFALPSFSDRMVNRGDTIVIPIGNKRLIRSFNGGSNWQIIYNKFNVFIGSFDLVNNTIFALGYYPSQNQINLLLKSTNWGSTWDSLYLFRDTIQNKGRINFISETIGYCFASHSGFFNPSKTTDGGRSWFPIQTDTKFGQVDKLIFLSEREAYIEAFPGTIYRSLDSGRTFHPMGINSYLNDVRYINSTTAIMLLSIANNGLIYRTSNNGQNWTQILNYSNWPYHTVDFKRIAFINNTIYVAAGNSGGVFKSTNGGQNFFNITKYNWPISFQSVDFINTTSGFAVGVSTGIFQTTNSGVNWFENENFKTVTNIFNRNIFKVDFTDENTGYISSDTGIFKSTNSGNNWFFLSQSKRTNDFYFHNNSTGWAIFYYNREGIFKTTDGGNSFILQREFNNFNLNDIEFFDENTGLVTALNGFTSDTLLFRTTNSGQNWYGINLQGDYNRITKIDNDTALLVPYLTGIGFMRTTDKGASWFLNPTSVNTTDMKFINSNLGVASSMYEYKYIYTTNSGYTWNKSMQGLGIELNAVYMDKTGFGIMAGSDGRIFRTINFGGITSINNPNSIVENDFRLNQNYPNPFNAQTIISFNINKKSQYKINIYDIRGRLIKTLINKFLNTGSYEVAFNAENISSGVYFYTLEAEDNLIKTRKMILMK